MPRVSKYDLSRVMVNECRRNKRQKTQMLDSLDEFEQLETMLTILVHFKYMLRFVNDHLLTVDSVIELKLNQLAPQFKQNLEQCFDKYNQLLVTSLEPADSGTVSGPGRLLQFIRHNEIEYDPEQIDYFPFKCDDDNSLKQFLQSQSSAEDSEALNQSFSLINDFILNITSQQSTDRKMKVNSVSLPSISTRSLSSTNATNNYNTTTTTSSRNSSRSTSNNNNINNEDNIDVVPQAICETIMLPRNETKKRKRTSKKPSYVAPKFSSISYLSEATKKAEMSQILLEQIKLETDSSVVINSDVITSSNHNNSNINKNSIMNNNNNNNNNNSSLNEVPPEESLEIESDILQVEYWCSFQGCLYKSKSLASVKQHELQRHVKQVLSCCMDGCSEVFESKVYLDRHMADAHSNSKSFLCTINGCNHNFPNKFRLRAHVKEKHEDQYLVCKLCDKVFKTRKNRADHLRMIHDEGEYKCTEEGCDFVANIRQRLQDHKKFRHFKMRPCTVEGCGEMVPRFRLSHHLNLKHKISNYVCSWPDCGKSFGDNSTLKGHVRIHLNFKRFKCKWTDCTYASEQRHTVISHVRLCHLKLPRTKKKQMELNISDDSIALNAYDFVETCREDICV